MPITRLSPPPGVFRVAPDRPLPEAGMSACKRGLAVASILWFIAGIILAFTAATGQRDGVDVLAAVLVIGGAIVGAWQARLEWRYARRGRWIQGRLLGFGEGHGEHRYVYADYAFEAPDGREVTGRAPLRRSDVDGPGSPLLPPPGTPIGVLFLDARNHLVI